MWIIRFAIENRVKVAVTVILLGLFGAISLRTMPVQMTPTLDKPEISITTDYPGAAPAEVEEQITTPIEEKLQAVEGIKRITSSSSEGRSSVGLEFDWGVDKDIAVIDIIKRLSRVRDMPEDADEPIVIAGTSSDRKSIYWANMRGTVPIDKLRQIADDQIAPRLERVEGVAEVGVYGGEEREIQVVLDFPALTARGLTPKNVSNALKRENLNVRGGSLDIGKRRYLVRTVGLFRSAEDIKSVIIAKTESGNPVYIRDVAEVYDRFKKRDSVVRIMGEPAIAFGIKKKSGSNTIEVINGVQETIGRLNREFKSKGIAIYESYDSSDYIWESISFVVWNFILGAILSVVVLLLFLKSFRSTIIVAISIPVVTAAGFMLLNFFGRSLNIISLAGMAFAVGMVVDNAIVVLENIHTHLSKGEERVKAALNGTSEVWGAVLASTLTTMAVFVPIVYIDEEAGQLFKDIAIAVSVSVFVSLLVSVTVIPSLAAKIMHREDNISAWSPIKKIFNLLDKIGGKVAGFFISTSIKLSQKKLGYKLIFCLLIVAFSLMTITLLPKLEYLPKGNRNLVFVFFKPHVGSNFDTVREYSDRVADKLLALPELKYMFHVVSPRFNGIGVRVKDKYRFEIPKVARKINGQLKDLPGFKFVRAFQTSLFSRLVGSDIEIEIRGPDLSKISAYAQGIQGKLFATKGVSFARSNHETGNPEIRVTIDRERAADLNLSVRDIANAVETLVAGRKATLFKEGGNEYDITVKGPESGIDGPASLGQVVLHGKGDKAIRLDSVTTIKKSVGPTQINHIELERSVTLDVTKKDNVPLEQVVETIEKNLLDPLRKKLDDGYTISISGSARDLARTADQLSGSMLLAILIVYLLMAALFESFLYPFIIMFAVPLAASGAILAVRITGRPLDVLTMLGFVILAGIVVNNAILLVHKARNGVMFENMEGKEAMVLAVRSRIRPIFMSSGTTILGLLPLVVRGGAGSELYSGLATAITGGLLVSTLFTLVLIPALWFIVEDLKNA